MKKRCFGMAMMMLFIMIWYVPPGEGAFMLLFCAIAGLLALFWGNGLARELEFMLSAFLCAHWSVLFRMPVYYMQRSRMLRRVKTEWRNEEKLSAEAWDCMSREERVKQIQQVTEYELKGERQYPCRIVPYYREYREDWLWVQIDSEKQRILWNCASIEHYSPQIILEELILAIQRYQFYCRLDTREQKALKAFWERDADAQLLYWTYLLYEKLREKRDMASYDIITRQYARAKSIWYCKK